MGKNRTIEELMTPDSRVVHFSPMSLLMGTEMKPEASAKYLQDMVTSELAGPSLPGLSDLYGRLGQPISLRIMDV